MLQLPIFSHTTHHHHSSPLPSYLPKLLPLPTQLLHKIRQFAAPPQVLLITDLDSYSGLYRKVERVGLVFREEAHCRSLGFVHSNWRLGARGLQQVNEMLREGGDC